MDAKLVTGGNMYAKWECRAVVRERAALERARDARMGNLADTREFDTALAAFLAAKDAHVASSGCTDFH